MQSDWKQFRAWALEEVEATLAAFPAPLRELGYCLGLDEDELTGGGLE